MGDIADIYDGTHQTPNYQEQGIKFLSVENIKTLDSDKYISKEDFKNDFKIHPEYGDVLMTRIGSVGVMNFIKTNELLAYYVSLALIKPYYSNGLFLKFLVESLSVQKEIWSKTLHIAFPKKINKNEIGKISISLPILGEQKEIATLLESIDNMITLHQRRFSMLNQKKQAILSKMFPKLNENIPSLRFNSFHQEWKLTSLGDLGEVLTGNTPSTKIESNWEKDNKGYIWITPSDIYKYKTSDSMRYLSEEGWKKARTVPEGSVLVTSIASIGKNTINKVPAAFNQQINAIIPKENSAYFILTCMEKNKVQFNSIAGKTATSIINKTDFKKFKVKVPSLLNRCL